MRRRELRSFAAPSNSGTTRLCSLRSNSIRKTELWICRSVGGLSQPSPGRLLARRCSARSSSRATPGQAERSSCRAMVRQRFIIEGYHRSAGSTLMPRLLIFAVPACIWNLLDKLPELRYIAINYFYFRLLGVVKSRYAADWRLDPMSIKTTVCFLLIVQPVDCRRSRRTHLTAGSAPRARLATSPPPMPIRRRPFC